MDDSVIRAMARWPDVPAVHGWLSLDRRGRWLLKGESLSNRAALAFIARNYVADEAGRWYFQNGPQRVFVTLEAAPLVLRIEPGGGFSDHTGRVAGVVRAVFMDEQGGVWLSTDLGPGLLDDRDLDGFAARLCDRNGEAPGEDDLIERVERVCAAEDADLWVREAGGLLPLTCLAFDDAPRRLGFVRDPGPAQNA